MENIQLKFEEHGFELCVHLHVDFKKNKYTLGPLYPWVSYSQIQPTANREQYFRSVVRIPQMGRAGNPHVHRSTPFYLRDFSICGTHGGYGTKPCEYGGTTVFQR